MLGRVLSVCLALTVGVAFGADLVAQLPRSAGPLDSGGVRRWREDLAFLARELPLRHRNLYHTTPKPVFDSAFAALDRRLPALARHQVILELARIVALVGDGHTNVAPTRDSAIGFRSSTARWCGA